MASAEPEPELSVPETVANMATERFLFIIFCVIGGLVLIVDLVLMILTMKTQRQRMVRNSFTSMDFTAMQGAAMLVTYVILAGIHSVLSPDSDNILTAICYAQFVLLITGITNCQGALLMKAAAVYYHFQDKPKRIQNWMPCIGIVILLLADAALCIGRAFTSPFSWDSTLTMCVDDNNMYWTIGFLVYKGFILLFAVLMGVAAMLSTKHVQTDLKHVTLASLLNVLMFIAAVVLMFAFTKTTVVTYTIHGSLILGSCLFTLLALIKAKIKSITQQSRNTERDTDTGHLYHTPSPAASEPATPGDGAESYQSSGNYENATP